MTEEERKRLEQLRAWKKQEAQEAKDLEELKRLEEEFNRQNSAKPEAEETAGQKEKTKADANTKSKPKSKIKQALEYVAMVAIVIVVGVTGSYIKKAIRESKNYKQELNDRISSIGHTSPTLPNTIEQTAKKSHNTRPCPICFDGIKKSKEDCAFCYGEGQVQYIEYPDNKRYSGRIVDGKKDGKGMLVFPDGGVYIGDFKDDMYHGKGIYTWASGASYNGQWKSGKRNGLGRQIFESGDIFEGTYVDDVRNGEGIYLWIKGQRFEGTWQNGKMNGPGKYTYANGTTKKGIWKEDKLVSESTSSKSTSSKSTSSSGKTFTYKTWSEIMAESNAMVFGSTPVTSKNVAEGRFEFHEAEIHGFNSLPLTDFYDSDSHSHSETSHIHTTKRCPNHRETFPTSSYCIVGTYHCYKCALDDLIPTPPTEHQCPNCRKWHYSNTHHTCVCEACDGKGYIEL